MERTAYSWAKLTSLQCIRLMELRPSAHEHLPLYCNLIEVDLAGEVPPFEAM